MEFSLPTRVSAARYRQTVQQDCLIDLQKIGSLEEIVGAIGFGQLAK
jgi:hypothetical protein